jgi:hypothetical protein
LLATIVGFSFVIFFLVATLDLSATLNGNHSFNPNKYIHCVVGELAVLGLFAIPAASRFSSRAQVGILDAKFAEIERVRRRPKRQKR